MIKSYPETAAKPHLPTLVAILVGEEAFKLLSEEAFLNDWDCLYRACPWATVFQSREFVATWYRIFKNEYQPVVLKAGSPGRLTGLLTLAVPVTAGNGNKGARLVGAGQYDAEYQVWLTEPSNGEAFIQAALEEVQRRFPRQAIHFRFLPPGTPLGWLQTNSMWQKRCVLQPYKRPLMEMRHPDFPRLLRKTEFRNKLNRLKRLGEFRFERLTEPEKFAGILQALTIQYDFRQGAMFNKNQFRDNPLKTELLLALFEKNLLHVTLMTVNEEIVASIVAVNGKDWVHLGGINIHSPFYANASPGFVHFLLLGQQLAQEEVSVFDLTPGEDAYKERYATGHDQVHELTIAASLPFLLKRRLRKEIHSRLIKAGVRPMSVEVALKRKVYLFKARIKQIKEQGPLVAITGQVKQLLRGSKPGLYVRTNAPAERSVSILVHENHLADLLDFEQKGSRLTRWEFLEDAMRRFETGQRSFTWSENGRLLGCAWLSVPGPVLTRDLPNADLPEGAAVLSGLYGHPAGRERWPSFLAAVAGQAGRDKHINQVYAVVRSGDIILSQALKTAGFSPVSA